MTLDGIRALFDYDRWANRRLCNHGTHHRSEAATMLTMLGVSPPPTDLTIYHLVRTGQMT